MTYYVYVITHATTSRFYVGFTSDVVKRWKHHIATANSQQGNYLHNALRYHGVKSFEFKILQTFERKEEALSAEKYWISFLHSNEPGYGFNLTPGGECWPMSAHIAGGRKAGGKTLKNLWCIRREFMLHNARKAAAIGGRIAAKTHLLSYSQSERGRKCSSEIMRSMGLKRRKIVLQTEIIDASIVHEHKSAAQAAKFINVPYSTLCWCAQHEKELKGYIWKYK